MEFGLIPCAAGMIQKQAVTEIMQCSSYTQKYGLALTPEQAAQLADLEDVMTDAGLSFDETRKILEKLEVTELAALLKSTRINRT